MIGMSSVVIFQAFWGMVCRSGTRVIRPFFTEPIVRMRRMGTCIAVVARWFFGGFHVARCLSLLFLLFGIKPWGEKPQVLMLSDSLQNILSRFPMGLIRQYELTINCSIFFLFCIGFCKFFLIFPQKSLLFSFLHDVNSFYMMGLLLQFWHFSQKGTIFCNTVILRML